MSTTQTASRSNPNSISISSADFCRAH